LDSVLFNKLLEQEISTMCQLAIAEDLAVVDDHDIDSSNMNNDITAELIEPDTQANATLITRDSGVFCGQKWVNKIYILLGNDVKLNWQISDGELMKPGQILCYLDGNARKLLTGERSAMNFTQILSATATLTHQYVQKLDNPNCQLLDTRKTIPGMRFGQKYAVQCGGGINHRLGLADAFLIKENHIIACGGIADALTRAKQTHPNSLLEIEVENIEELQQAIEGEAQVIMLDNFNLDGLAEAVVIRDQSKSEAKLEASGNVNLETIANIGNTGVDFISAGALTKNIKAIDLSLRVGLS